MPLRPISIASLRIKGEALERPECVAVGRDGRIFISDLRSAVAIVRNDGTIRRIDAVAPAANGIALDKRERILIANFGVRRGVPGSLERLELDTGKIETVCHSVGARTLTASNTPVVAADGSIYCTHATWAPDLDSVNERHGDGMIYRVDPAGQASEVASGLLFAKGLCFDSGEKMLYATQTLAGTVLRYVRRPDGRLGPPQPYGPQIGVIPQGFRLGQLGGMSAKERGRIGLMGGCAFDIEGNLWIALIMANRIIAITPNHSVFVLIDDPDGRVLNLPTNITFGGADMCDVYIGMAGAPHIVKARSPVPGLPLAHQR